MAIKRKDDDMLTNPRATNAPRFSGDPYLDQAILANLNNPNRTNAPNISGNPYLDQQILANNPTLGTTPQMPTTPIYPRTSQSVPDAPSTPEAPGTNPTLWKTAVAATTPTTTPATPAAQAVPAGAQPAANPAAAANAAPLENSVEYWANQIYKNGKFLNPYQAGYDAKYDAIMNRQPFSYDLESDPQWAAYRDQYTRLGQRAYDDALARMSARTGGLASSYAGSAAAQAYGDYMQQMTGKIPELYRLAYDMYSQDAARDISDLNAIRGMAGDAYDWWQGDFNRLGTALSVAQSMRDYADKKDAAKIYAYGDGDPYEIGSTKGQYFVESAQPGQTMTGGDGSIWTKEADGSVTITNNGHTWKIQAPAKAVKSSGGGSGGSGGSGSGGGNYTSLDDVIGEMPGGMNEGQVRAYLKENGFNSTDQSNGWKMYNSAYGYDPKKASPRAQNLAVRFPGPNASDEWRNAWLQEVADAEPYLTENDKNWLLALAEGWGSYYG